MPGARRRRPPQTGPSITIQVRRWSGGALEDRITLHGYGNAEDWISKVIEENQEPIFSYRFLLTSTGAKGVEHRVTR